MEGDCIAVVAGKRAFTVDAGEGSNRDIQLSQIPSKPDALLLTHFHSDHIASLGDIALGHWGRNASTETLLVIGPPFVKSVVRGFREAFGLDDSYRFDYPPTASPLLFPIFLGERAIPLSRSRKSPTGWGRPDNLLPAFQGQG